MFSWSQEKMGFVRTFINMLLKYTIERSGQIEGIFYVVPCTQNMFVTSCLFELPIDYMILDYMKVRNFTLKYLTS